MTRDDIIRMAREAGLTTGKEGPDKRALMEHIATRLARAAYQRGLEDAAQVCDEKARRNFPWGSENSDIYHAQADWANVCARAIRALKDNP